MINIKIKSYKTINFITYEFNSNDKFVNEDLFYF